jgi:hypothetical protein
MKKFDITMVETYAAFASKVESVEKSTDVVKEFGAVFCRSHITYIRV